MLHYDFMRNAFAAAGLVGLVSGLAGYFLVLRGQAFAGHALSHVGFTGASAAVLIGWPPLWGLIATTLLAGLAMGALGERLAGRDVAIGIVLAVSLGLGLLCLHFFTASASQATALLFGNVLGVDRATLLTLLGLAVVTLGGLAAIMRPLLFASLQPELAEAQGVPTRLVSLLFLGVVALATAGSVQIVGVLLVFSLMVAPAATAQRLTNRFWPGLLGAGALAVAEAWAGIVCAWYSDWPSSFWITAIGGAFYAAALAATAQGPLLQTTAPAAVSSDR